MPMKLNVGVSRKIGLPDYCSAGASCNLEVELDSGLLQHDPAAFQAQVREAFDAAQQAVNDELTRLQAPLSPAPRQALPAPPATPAGTIGRAGHDGGSSARSSANHGSTAPRDHGPKPCTDAQARALRAIARDLAIDLEPMLRDD